MDAVLDLFRVAGCLLLVLSFVALAVPW